MALAIFPAHVEGGAGNFEVALAIFPAHVGKSEGGAGKFPTKTEFGLIGLLILFGACLQISLYFLMSTCKISGVKNMAPGTALGATPNCFSSKSS